MTVAQLHLAATAFMAGVIVFVQVVHYPLMGRVDDHRFMAYQRAHTFRTGFVVGPPMIVELATAVMIFLERGPAAPWASLGLALLAIIWMSTALVQAPTHARLERGFDPAVHRWLVRTNWVRTVAWLARVPIAVVLLTP